MVRWRLLDLCRRILADFRVVLHPRSVGRLLRRLGLCLRVPRPYHPKANFAHQSLFKRYFPAIARRRLPPHAAGRKVEIWVEDEARIGQQGGMTRIWTEKGSSPRAQWDNRRESLDLFGSSCPQRGAAGIIAPQANTESMNLLVGEVSLHVEKGSYALILVDRAGWHLSKRLVLPENTGLLQIPAYSPEHNSMEPAWKYFRANDFAFQLWDSCEEIEQAVMDAWNRFANNPGQITSITGRNWMSVEI